MQMALTEEQQMIQDMARKFAETELEPMAAELDKTGNREVLLSNLKKLADLGFMGLNVKAEYGGSEAGVVAFSVAMTEIARACASTAVTMSVTNMVAEVIQEVGNEEQRQKYIPKICSGEFAAGSFCLSEANAGSDPSGMRASAIKDGEDWVINGAKQWISSAEYAGVFVVVAKEGAFP